MRLTGAASALASLLLLVLADSAAAQTTAAAALPGPNCEEKCQYGYNPDAPQDAGWGCIYVGVTQGEGTGCRFTTHTCGYEHECDPWAALSPIEGTFEIIIPEDCLLTSEGASVDPGSNT